MATLAFAWVLAGRCDGAVCGPNRAAHLDPVLAARELELSPDDRTDRRLLCTDVSHPRRARSDRRLLPMDECIAAMEEVLASLARGELYNPLRSACGRRTRA